MRPIESGGLQLEGDERGYALEVATAGLAPLDPSMASRDTVHATRVFAEKLDQFLTDQATADAPFDATAEEVATLHEAVKVGTANYWCAMGFLAMLGMLETYKPDVLDGIIDPHIHTGIQLARIILQRGNAILNFSVLLDLYR